MGHDTGEPMSTDPIGDAAGETPTTELVSGAVEGHCVNCQTPLASDQRYCLNCGQRRGKPRFPVLPVPASEPAPAAAAPRPPHRPRMSSGASLVAGVATLLIALGVGVLIGHDSNNTTPQKAANQIITVGGGSGGGASTTANSSNPAQATKYHMDAALYVTTFAFVFNKDKYAQMSATQKKAIDDNCTTEAAGRGRAQRRRMG